MHFPALTSAIVALAVAPALHEHYPDEGAPTHAFLLVEAATGNVVRAEGGEILDASHPWGDLRRLILAVAGLEDGRLDSRRTVHCDSTCWAHGSHGEVALVDGLAWGCDTWDAALPDVDPAELARIATTLGLHETAKAEGDSGRVTAEGCVAFWRVLSSLSIDLRADTSTQLLAVAGASVSSPRGVARLLYDPHRRTRAFVFGGAEGAWAIGGRSVLGREWAFAVYIPRGTPALAASRTARLLEETRRVARRSTVERGGVATDEPLDEDDGHGG
jgi:hypothetical protein